MLSWLAGLELIPEAISTTAFTLLVIASFFTSAVSAAIGIGGGLMLLALMANLMPANAIIPVHAVVQFGSTTGRTLALLRHVDWNIVIWFSVGGVFGSILGGQVAVNIPPEALQVAIGAFILYSTWLPIVKFSTSRRSMTFLGGGTSFLAMIVGGVAPFIFVVLKDLFSDRRGVVSTLAAILTVQALLKAVIFGLFGFMFAPWVPVIILMVITGFIGTLVGKLFLERVPTEKAQPVLKVVLTLLAGRLLYLGVTNLMG